MVHLVNNPPANTRGTRDRDSISGLERSPGEGNGKAFQYCCLENPMDRGHGWARVHGVAKNQIQLSAHEPMFLTLNHNSVGNYCLSSNLTLDNKLRCFLPRTLVSGRGQLRESFLTLN